MKPLLILMLLAGVAGAGGCSAPWTRGDSYRQAAVVAVSAADWLQTREIAAHPDRWEERNTFLGDHPSRGRVNMFFLSTALMNAVIAYSLPRDWREGWQYMSIGYEGWYVWHNYRGGIRP